MQLINSQAILACIIAALITNHPMLLALLGISLGLALLIWSADRFVAGAVALSHHFGIPAIIIGIVIIGFGTSAPELLISTLAAWQGNSGLAIGNAIGSNIANIALILGVTAILTPVIVASGTIKREFPVLLIATGLVWIVLRDDLLSWGDGVLLMTALFIALAFLTIATMKANNNAMREKQVIPNYSIVQAVAWTLFGLALLLVSSRILVINSIDLAIFFGVSDVVIGLTIVAIGTSLPELAASVTGALKHHSDLAIGNVVGSNIFNTLGVIGVPGLIHSYAVPKEILTRDFPIMLGLTLLLMLMAFTTYRSNGMHRISGTVLLLCFVTFQVMLYKQSVGS